MVYNLGAAGFSEFTKTIAALERMDYCAAADEMQNSNWFKQVGEQGKELVGMVKEYCR